MDIHSPNGRISTWLAKLSKALEARDSAAATALFAPDSYWRDMVSFTWNIKTMEGRDQIAAMLDATLGDARPTNWALTGDASEADGITEGWISFETASGRGEGHLRLNDQGAWTLLTTLKELKGHEEKRGPTREKGIAHGVHRGRETWAEARTREQAELGYKTQPYVVVIGGGQGGIGLGARLRRLGVPT
ncbi:MAG: NAD(P)/FAD-dependent oxidoreductase, partial [Alphaproteobacteria bacterium]